MNAKRATNTDSLAKNRSPRRQGGAERREQIRSQLEKMFLVEGFRDLTVGNLAKRLSCSNRTLYDIAPSKEEIFLLVLDNWLDRIRRLGRQAVLEKTDPVDRLEVFFNSANVEARGASAKFIEDVNSYLPAKQIWERHLEKQVSFLEEIIAEGIKRGNFKPLNPNLAAELLLSTVTRVDELVFHGHSGLSYEEAFAESQELMLNGLKKY